MFYIILTFNYVLTKYTLERKQLTAAIFSNKSRIFLKTIHFGYSKINVYATIRWLWNLGQNIKSGKLEIFINQKKSKKGRKRGKKQKRGKVREKEEKLAKQKTVNI